MVENGMEFDEKEVSDLANALFEDAVQVRKKKRKKERSFIFSTQHKCVHLKGQCHEIFCFRFFS